MAIGGSKHFGFVKLRPDLQPVKVVTVTLGHPVVKVGIPRSMYLIEIQSRFSQYWPSVMSFWSILSCEL